MSSIPIICRASNSLIPLLPAELYQERTGAISGLRRTVLLYYTLVLTGYKC